jgi:hypothetical protein
MDLASTVIDTDRLDPHVGMNLPAVPGGLAADHAAVLGPTDPRTAPAADPTREYVAGAGPRDRWEDTWNPYLSKTLRALAARWGDAAVDWMLDDDKVKGSLLTIVESVFCDGVQVAPALQADLDELGQPRDPAQARDAERAREIADYVAAALDACDDDPAVWGAEHLFTALAYRSSLAEIVLDTFPTGSPFAGKECLLRLKVKPRPCWLLAIDRHDNVQYIIARTADGSTRLLPRDRFAFLAWLPRHDQPFGTYLLDSAFAPWEFKQRLYPKYFDYIDQFATPGIKATTPPGAQSRPHPQTGKLVSPQEDLATNLQAFRSNRIVVSPAGTEVDPFSVPGEGAAHLSAFDWCDRAIVHALLQQTRATLEAQYGSRADSQTAQDVTGLVVRMAKLAFASMFARDIVYPLVARNFSTADADRFPTRVMLGDTEHQDLPQTLNAFAAAFASGMFVPQDLPYLLKFLGLPHSPDDPGRVRSMTMMKMLALTKGQGGSPPANPSQPPGATPPKQAGPRPA